MASQDWLMGTQQHAALEAITSPPAPVKKRRGPSSGDDISELTSFTQRGACNRMLQPPFTIFPVLCGPGFLFEL